MKKIARVGHFDVDGFANKYAPRKDQAIILEILRYDVKIYKQVINGRSMRVRSS